ncbi:hypothetical protein HII12_004717 [Brettanomyces bruxellensis]|uniref:Hydantoinase n=1 Tax=Dekkera bruxellensis TaxID=5007 RepID=A0A8H6B979_DEKBR|nr:hypothetical protein HII12_004717 [Brettanomyces bruxellensis]
MGNRKLIIGVDVGGTNSDLVVVEPEKLGTESKGVIAWHKSVTTPDVSVGVEHAITTVLGNPKYGISKNEIISITIGTTHFINAVIERDANRLEKVAVIRLAGPFGQSLPPFGDFPEDLADIINGYFCSIDGGSHIGGGDIRKLDKSALRRECKKIRSLGITAVAIVGIFSNMNASQEKEAGAIVSEEIPGCDVVLSHTISGIEIWTKIIHSFVGAARRLGLGCPVMLSQNDGTVLSIKGALETPIKTFSSGATNSMRGAAILCSEDPDVKHNNVIVCDVGGTTTDVGQILSSGFPRQSAMYSYVGGVRMNFSMPHVVSIGLGGGSIVRGNETTGVTVGPDSTGSDIVTKSLVFGGNTVTTTDVSVSIRQKESNDGNSGELIEIGDPNRVKDKFSSNYLEKYQQVLKRHLEKVIDRVKTSRRDIPVIFVGGGSFIAPDKLAGTSKVIKPPYSQVANAIGAALGKISSSISEFKTLKGATDEEKQSVINELIARAKNDAILKGASSSSLEVVNIVSDAVPYVENVYDFEVKVVGDVDYDKALELTRKAETEQSLPLDNKFLTVAVYKHAKVSSKEQEQFDYENYRPKIVNGIWKLTETDIDFIGRGAYILGCGGGGDPHSSVIELKRMIRHGHNIQILTLDKFSSLTSGTGRAINVGYFGSPTISGERLHADEILEALDRMEQYEVAFWTAAMKNLPVIDLDLMGRAYPTQWQSLPSVYSENRGYPYLTVSDGNGFELTINSAIDDIQMEDIMRDCMYNRGCQGACVEPSMDIEQMEQQTVHNPVSLSWRIGRAAYLAAYHSDLDRLPSYIINSSGGSKGYGYGVVEIESLPSVIQLDKKVKKTVIRMPFKNENIVAYQVEDNRLIPLCSVPDLITLVDEDGNAVGTQDYRYGLIVYIMVFAASNKWRTQRGLQNGGPQAFGEEFKDVKYQPIGDYFETLPVSLEYEGLHGN